MEFECSGGMGRYSNVGKISEDYVHEQREIRQYGLFVSSELILKLYDMQSIGKDNTITSAKLKHFLEDELTKGNIEPYSGLGVAILSKDTLNVARWRDYILHNQLYVFENEKLEDARISDIGEEGSFCIFELEIVEHERKAWNRYLMSEKTERNKEDYLQDMFIDPNFVSRKVIEEIKPSLLQAIENGIRKAFMDMVNKNWVD